MGQTVAPKSFAQPAELGTTNDPSRLVRPSTPDGYINGPQLRGNPSLINTPAIASPNSTNTATAPSSTAAVTNPSIAPQRYVGDQGVDESTYQKVVRNPIGRMISY